MSSSQSSTGTPTTHQMNTWSGDFGRDYTDRNTYTVDDLDVDYKECFGLTRTELFARSLEGIPRDIRILEVGSNTGNGLRCLQKLGFTRLTGIELQRYAIEKARTLCPGIDIIEGSALDIPFKDGYFDLVFTGGVLIHISPKDIHRVLAEVHRCSSRYIWGHENYADQWTELNYRGNEGLLWKTNYAGLYLEQFPDLKLLKEDRLKYSQNDNYDSMYLLEKKQA